MNINYLILAHKNLLQLKILIDRLLAGEGRIYIHLDSRWQLTEDSIRNLDNNRVTIIKQRYKSNIDTWALVEATISLIKAAIKDTKDSEPAYYYLLSGQDYPIKPLDKLEHYLTQYYPKPFIDTTPYDKDNWVFNKFRSPIHNKIVFVNRTIVSKIHSPLLRKPILKILTYLLRVEKSLEFIHLSRKFRENNIPMYGGSAWWCLPDVVVKHIIENLDNKQKVKSLLTHILTPEETVFQILTMTSPLSEMVEVNSNECKTQNCLTFASFNIPSQKAICGHPSTILKSDLGFIMMRPEFFARKFDTNVTPDIYKSIDSYYNNEDKCNNSNL